MHLCRGKSTVFTYFPNNHLKVILSFEYDVCVGHEIPLALQRDVLQVARLSSLLLYKRLFSFARRYLI